MKYLKIIVVIVLIICIILLAAFIAFVSPFLGSDGISMPSEKKLEQYYNENYNDFLNISDYLIDLKYSYIRIDDVTYDGENIICYENNKEIIYEIQNDVVLRSINKLYENGYIHIIKENGDISFVRWTSLDSSTGILYTFDATLKQKNDTTKDMQLTSLSKSNWYIYKHVS